MRILNRFQKTLDNRFKSWPYVVSSPQKNIYMCPSLKYRFIFFYGLTSPTSDVILLVVLKRQFDLINKYHYCIQNTFFHNNACWETCILPRNCIIFKSIKNKLLVGNAMGKMEGRPITRRWQYVVVEIEDGP